jgi:hypothetical protein
MRPCLLFGVNDSGTPCLPHEPKSHVFYVHVDRSTGCRVSYNCKNALNGAQPLADLPIGHGRAAALPNLAVEDPLHILLWIFSAALLAGIGHACLSGMTSV